MGETVLVKRPLSLGKQTPYEETPMNWSFVLFNEAWSQKGHSASNATVNTRIKLHIMYIIITYYRHIYYPILAFISITNL